MSAPHALPRDLAVSASIATADLLTLEVQLERLLNAGVDSLHLDLEDGRFVPLMNLGTRVIEAAVRWGKLPVDVHLMVEDPEAAIDLMDGLPLHTVAVHVESTRYPRRVLRLIRDHGWKAAIAFNPATPVIDVATLLPYLDNVLMLTTEPEHEDPPFLDARLGQLSAAVQAATAWGVTVTADGGVNTSNVDLIASTGVDTVVVGRALLDSPHPDQFVAGIKKGNSHE